MTKEARLSRSPLTEDESRIVGEPGDLVDEERVPDRPRSATVMFSLRLDRQTFEALGDLAERRGRTFSDFAREALRDYVARSGGDPSLRLLEAIAAKVGVDPIEGYPSPGGHGGPKRRR